MSRVLQPHVPQGTAGEHHDDWAAWAGSLPVSQAAGLKVTELVAGRSQVLMPASEWPLNPSGGVHGGLSVAWADHCVMLTLTPLLPPGRTCATLSTTAQYLRPAAPPLSFVTTVDHLALHAAQLTVEVKDAEGRLAVRVTATASLAAGIGDLPEP